MWLFWEKDAEQDLTEPSVAEVASWSIVKGQFAAAMDCLCNFGLFNASCQVEAGKESANFHRLPAVHKDVVLGQSVGSAWYKHAKQQGVFATYRQLNEGGLAFFARAYGWMVAAEFCTDAAGAYYGWGKEISLPATAFVGAAVGTPGEVRLVNKHLPFPSWRGIYAAGGRELVCSAVYFSGARQVVSSNIAGAFGMSDRNIATDVAGAFAIGPGLFFSQPFACVGKTAQGLNVSESAAIKKLYRQSELAYRDMAPERPLLKRLWAGYSASFGRGGQYRTVSLCCTGAVVGSATSLADRAYEKCTGKSAPGVESLSRAPQP